jgi:hypothetical protein
LTNEFNLLVKGVRNSLLLLFMRFKIKIREGRRGVGVSGIGVIGLVGCTGTWFLMGVSEGGKLSSERFMRVGVRRFQALSEEWAVWMVAGIIPLSFAV